MTLATFSTSYDMIYTKDKVNKIFFRINSRDLEDLQKLANQNGLSISFLCRQIITSYLISRRNNEHK